jgi:hypothetical protein
MDHSASSMHLPETIPLALCPHNVKTSSCLLCLTSRGYNSISTELVAFLTQTHPTQPNPNTAPSTEATIKPTLEFNSRIHHPKWHRAVQTFAVLHYKEVYRRCGSLTAVLMDSQWPLHTINRTPAANPADPDVITPRPDVALPGPHAVNAPNAALRIHERQLSTHDACLAGLRTLLGALVLSIGPANTLLLADPVHGMMLVTRGDVMAMMQQKHGTPPASPPPPTLPTIAKSPRKSNSPTPKPPCQCRQLPRPSPPWC